VLGSLKRAGASTDEPSLNMMREMTEGRGKTHSAICPLWMALTNVYPVWGAGQLFFAIFFELIVGSGVMARL